LDIEQEGANDAKKAQPALKAEIDEHETNRLTRSIAHRQHVKPDEGSPKRQ
jgi:hypothetical protein